MRITTISHCKYSKRKNIHIKNSYPIALITSNLQYNRCFDVVNSDSSCQYMQLKMGWSLLLMTHTRGNIYHMMDSKESRLAGKKVDVHCCKLNKGSSWWRHIWEESQNFHMIFWLTTYHLTPFSNTKRPWHPWRFSYPGCQSFYLIIVNPWLSGQSK